MRRRARSPIFMILQLAIAGVIFWRLYQFRAFDSGNDPLDAMPDMAGTFRIIMYGMIAIIALNLLYPLIAWGIGTLRSRQQTWTPQDRFAIPGAEESPNEVRQCPSCGASLFDDSPACQWCGARLS